MLLVGVSLVVLTMTLVRLGRGRAHLRWLAAPFAWGSRSYTLQFLVRAVMGLLAGYAAVLGFPRALTGASEARLSYVTIWAAAVLVVLSGLSPARRVNRLNLVATAAAAVALLVQLVQLNVPYADPVPLGSPVRGTWVATSAGRSGLVNHHYPLPQQRDALDLAVPFERSSGRPPTDLTEYPAYAEPVHAPGDGVVARAVDGQPDQAIGRRDPARPLGNHLVVDLGAGRYLLLAHLKPGSLQVGEGARVRRGQVLAAVGNSGNSTEPHLHLQLQSGPDLVDPAGVPAPGLFTWPVSFSDAGRERDGRITVPARDLRASDLVSFG